MQNYDQYFFSNIGVPISQNEYPHLYDVFQPIVIMYKLLSNIIYILIFGYRVM